VADQDNNRNPQQQQNDAQRQAPDQQNQQNQQGGRNPDRQDEQYPQVDTDGDGVTRDVNDRSPNDRGEPV
jgi:hypothetical protein